MSRHQTESWIYADCLRWSTAWAFAWFGAHGILITTWSLWSVIHT